MLARTTICLLALACIMAGVEARSTTPDIPGLSSGVLVATMEIFGADNVSITVAYPFSGMFINSSRMDLEVGKTYTLILVEQREED